jgi:ABC-type polysaccharide/polyol phosphate export permease
MGPLGAFVAACALAFSLRQTLWVLVVRDFKSRYRAQALGLFWSFAHPLVMMVTVTIAFRHVLKVQIENFQIFYLIGAVIWQFFSNSALATTGAMIDNATLVKRTTFPRFLFPIATVFSHALHFCMESALVFAFYVFYPEAYRFNGTLLALPFLALLLVTINIGVGLLTCGLNVRYRDVYYLVTSVLTMGFWVTPIIYPTDMAPPLLQPILRLNPIGGVMEGARDVLMRGQWPRAEYTLPAVATGLVLFILGCAVFRRQNLHIADYV